MPIGALMVEWGAKVAFPIDDSFAMGIMYSGATLMGAFFAQSEIWILGGESADVKVNSIKYFRECCGLLDLLPFYTSFL